MFTTQIFKCFGFTTLTFKKKAFYNRAFLNILMVKRIGSSIRKTRHKYRKSSRQSGKIGLSSFFKTFKPGQKVCLKTNSAVQIGNFHPRFHGKIGIIKSKKGKSYVVAVKIAGKEKLLQVHPTHIKSV